MLYGHEVFKKIKSTQQQKWMHVPCRVESTDNTGYSCPKSFIKKKQRNVRIFIVPEHLFEKKWKKSQNIENWASPFKCQWVPQTFDSFHRINRTHQNNCIENNSLLTLFDRKRNVLLHRNGWPNGWNASVWSAKWYCVHAIEWKNETEAVRHGQTAGIGWWKCGKLNWLCPMDNLHV